MIPITPKDVENLSQSFLTLDVMERAGLSRVDDEEGAAIVGRRRNANTNYAGIVFPYFRPGTSEVRDYRLRRDQPDLVRVEGQLKEKAKYLSPPGRSNMIYFPPGCTLHDLGNKDIPIVITEGEKKALAMSRLAWHELGDAAESPRFLALGLSGVWNFRGVIGKTDDAKGNRRPVKGMIPDFDLIEWKGREVSILFDQNAETNEKVATARRVLAKELTVLGASVHIIKCPEVDGCNGIDDVLHSWDTELGTTTAIEKGLELVLNSAASTRQLTGILMLLGDIEPFHTPSKETFVAVRINGHLEHHKIESKAFKRMFAHKVYEVCGKPPRNQELGDAIATLEGQALFEGPTREVHVRIAEANGKIYVDLCNEAWQIIEISQAGYRVIDSLSAPVTFWRSQTMEALPMPAGAGDLTVLRKYLNVDGDGLALVLAWLINCFRPDFPFPLLIISGEQGTAKSTATRVLRRLVDPSKTPIRPAPRNEQDLMIAASRSWVLGFDNLSGIQDWLSDALCRLSTGGGFGTRQLYTNDEESFFSAMRPIVINGIGDLATRSDLLDRALLVRLLPISPAKRKTEREFWRAFEADRPAIFAGLITAVSHALRYIDCVTISENPRMADFAEWAAAAEEALGLTKGSFHKAYMGNRKDAHSIVLEDSLLADVILDYCLRKIRSEIGLTMLLKEFHEELKEIAGPKRSEDKRFPRSGRGLRSSIERINPNLREIGISIAFLGRTGPEARLGASVTVCYQRTETSQPSQLDSHIEGFILPDEGLDADALYSRASA